MARQSSDFDVSADIMNVEELLRMLQAATEKEFSGMKKTCEGLGANLDHSQTERNNDERRRSSSSSSAGTPDSMYSACSANGSIFSRCSYGKEKILPCVENCQDEELPCSADEAAGTDSFETHESFLRRVRTKLEEAGPPFEKRAEAMLHTGIARQLHEVRKHTPERCRIPTPDSRNDGTTGNIQNTVVQETTELDASSSASRSRTRTCVSDVQRGIDDHLLPREDTDIKQINQAETVLWNSSIKPPGRETKESAFESSVDRAEGAVFTIRYIFDEFENHTAKTSVSESIHSMGSELSDVSNVTNDKVESDSKVRGVLKIYEEEGMSSKLRGEVPPVEVKLRKVNTRRIVGPASRTGLPEDLTYSQLSSSSHAAVDRSQNYKPTAEPDVVERVLVETLDEITDTEVVKQPTLDHDEYVQEYSLDQNVSAPEISPVVWDEDLIEVTDRGAVEPSITAHEYFQVYCPHNNTSAPAVLDKKLEGSGVEPTDHETPKGSKEPHEYSQENRHENRSFPQVVDSRSGEDLCKPTNEGVSPAERPITAEEYFREYGPNRRSQHDSSTFRDFEGKVLEESLMDITDHGVAERSVTGDEYFQEYGQGTRPYQCKFESTADKLSISLDEMPDVESTARGDLERSITAHEYFQLYNQQQQQQKDTTEAQSGQSGEMVVEYPDHGILHPSVKTHGYGQVADLTQTKEEHSQCSLRPELKDTSFENKFMSVDGAKGDLEEHFGSTSPSRDFGIGVKSTPTSSVGDCLQASHRMINDENSLFSSSTFSMLEKACGMGRASNQFADWNWKVDTSRTSSEFPDISTHSSPWVTFFDRLLRYGRSVKSNRRAKPVPRVPSDCSVSSKLVGEAGVRAKGVRSTTPALQGSSVQGKVKVVVRMRPFADHEKTCPMKQILCLVSEDTVMVRENNSNLLKQSCVRNKDEGISEFKVDKVVDDSYLQKHQWDKKADSQKRMYELIGLPCLEYTLAGYNTTIISYGQAGSGKTYSMTGDDTDEGRGIMPRLVEELMNQINTEFRDEFSVKVSYLEIYQERVRDLLVPPKSDPQTTRAEWQSRPDSRCGSVNGERRWRETLDENLYEECADDDTASFLSFGTCTTSRRAPSVCFDYPSTKNSKETLRVREHPVMGPYVDGLEWKDIYSWGDMEQVISEGAGRRTLGPTPSNRYSNRGHTVFTIRLFKEHGGRGSNVRVINLVDLAGTEKLNLCKKVSTERLDESRCINRSIAHLNDMIMNLSRNSKFVSYRNSALTKLLRESLGGNYKTFLIAHVSPAEQDFAESVNTLRYATEASHIHWTVTAYPERKRGFMMNGSKMIKTRNGSARILAGNGEHEHGDGGDDIANAGSRLPVFSSFKIPRDSEHDHWLLHP